MSELCQQILKELASEAADALEKAIALSESLPRPGGDLDSQTANCLHEIGFLAEKLGQYHLAESFYARVLDYDVPPSLRAGAHFRRGVSLNLAGELARSIESHKAAVELAGAWPLVGRLARFNLAGLLMATGDHAAAELHYRFLNGDADTDPLPRAELELRRAICLFRTGGGDSLETARSMAERYAVADPLAHAWLPQLLYDTALAAEIAGEYHLAEILYLRLCDRQDIDPNLTGGSCYRLGLCLEYQGRWLESMARYRTAIQIPHTWHEVRALARGQLARLLMTAEEYDEAAGLWAELLRDPASRELPMAASELAFKQAYCLFHAGQADAAQQVLATLAGAGSAGTFEADIDQLLANIFESRKEYESAVTCYTRILANAQAGMPLKTAALARLSAIQKLV